MKYPKDVGVWRPSASIGCLTASTGLKLRYFLPRAYIDSTPNMSAGYFVVPDEVIAIVLNCCSKYAKCAFVAEIGQRLWHSVQGTLRVHEQA
jgi:hypothetical protein